MWIKVDMFILFPRRFAVHGQASAEDSDPPANEEQDVHGPATLQPAAAGGGESEKGEEEERLLGHSQVRQFCT